VATRSYLWTSNTAESSWDPGDSGILVNGGAYQHLGHLTKEVVRVSVAVTTHNQYPLSPVSQLTFRGIGKSHRYKRSAPNPQLVRRRRCAGPLVSYDMTGDLKPATSSCHRKVSSSPAARAVVAVSHVGLFIVHHRSELSSFPRITYCTYGAHPSLQGAVATGVGAPIRCMD